MTLQNKKVNSSCSFPAVLDIAPYTTAVDRAHAGAPPTNVPDPILYALSGVVIHVGTTEHGHYYSLARDRGADATELAGLGAAATFSDLPGAWYEFNDTTVREFDVQRLPEIAFGGNGNRSAFMLVYDRIQPENVQTVPVPEVEPVEVSQEISQAVLDRLHKQHTQNTLQEYVCGAEYCGMVWHLLSGRSIVAAAGADQAASPAADAVVGELVDRLSPAQFRLALGYSLAGFSRCDVDVLRQAAVPDWRASVSDGVTHLLSVVLRAMEGRGDLRQVAAEVLAAPENQALVRECDYTRVCVDYSAAVLQRPVGCVNAA